MTEVQRPSPTRERPPEKQSKGVLDWVKSVFSGIRKIFTRTRSKIADLLGWDHKETHAGHADVSHAVPEGEARPDTGLVHSVEKLLGQAPEVETVCEDSHIREKIIPSKKSILEVVVQFAQREKLDLESMKVHKIVCDKEGNVVNLEVRAANIDGGNTEMTYTVAGRHVLNTPGMSRNSDEAKSTSIEWVWTSGDDFTKAESGGTVADYKDGKWVQA